MPRRARIDAPGALHHVICRGIERRKIFWGDSDRDDFSERLETILRETQNPCYAWAMLPNHFHLLLRTGNTPIAGVMRQLLSGYAGKFNRVHRRSGHLFQNRYKPIRPRLRQEPFMSLGHPQFRHDGRGCIEIAWDQPVGRNPSGLSGRGYRCRQ
jgi:REP element-mobilizing transposase RayT